MRLQVSIPGSSSRSPIVDMEERVRAHGLPKDAERMRKLKAMGFSDARLASCPAADEA
jgi:uncharacterized protein YlaN (UPF0358 family)